MNPQETEVLTSYADAAALILAAADDRQAFDAVVKSLTFHDAAKLLLSALEVSASVVTFADQHGAAPRETLGALIAGCRSEAID